MNARLVEIRRCARSVELNVRIAAELMRDAETVDDLRLTHVSSASLRRRAGYHLAFSEAASDRAFALAREAAP